MSDEAVTPGMFAILNPKRRRSKYKPVADPDNPCPDKSVKAKTHSCELCHKTFSVKKQLRIHLTVHTGEKPFECPICEKAFARRSNLYEHNKIHTQEKPHKCSVCGMAFSKNGTLRRHLLVHSGERPFTCDLCDKTFSRSHNLKSHYRVHTGEKCMKCSVCDMKFSNEDEFSAHAASHKNTVTVLHCEYCDRTCPSKRSYRRHVKTHTNSNTYDCSLCGKSFNILANMRRHYNRHKPMSCELCNEMFLNESVLTEHYKTHLNETVSSGTTSGVLGSSTNEFNYETDSERTVSPDDSLDDDTELIPESLQAITLTKDTLCRTSKNGTPLTNATCNSKSTSEPELKASSTLITYSKLEPSEMDHTKKEPENALEGNTKESTRTNKSKKGLAVPLIKEENYGTCRELSNNKLRITLGKKNVLETINTPDTKPTIMSPHKKLGETCEIETVKAENGVAGFASTQDKKPNVKLTKNEPYETDSDDTTSPVSGCDEGTISGVPEMGAAVMKGMHNGMNSDTSTKHTAEFTGVHEGKTAELMCTQDRATMSDGQAASCAFESLPMASMYQPRSYPEMPWSDPTTKVKKHMCELCHKTFAVKKQLRIHLRVHTGEKPFECQICEKSFGQRSNLYEHNKIHTQEKPHKCSLCDMAFAKNSTLRRHLLVHSGEKPFTCDLCNKTFSRSHNLKCHYRIHTGEKCFKCPVCELKFPNEPDLSTHLTCHENTEKLFQCDYCEKSCPSRRAFLRHIKIHTAAVCYNCSLCGKGYSDLSNLKKHYRRHKTVKCDLCSEVFLDETALAEHCKTHMEENDAGDATTEPIVTFPKENELEMDSDRTVSPDNDLDEYSTEPIPESMLAIKLSKKEPCKTVRNKTTCPKTNLESDIKQQTCTRVFDNKATGTLTKQETQGTCESSLPQNFLNQEESTSFAECKTAYFPDDEPCGKKRYETTSIDSTNGATTSITTLPIENTALTLAKELPKLDTAEIASPERGFDLDIASFTSIQESKPVKLVKKASYDSDLTDLSESGAEEDEDITDIASVSESVTKRVNSEMSLST